ncbi:hypothetical protein EVJ32_10700 [Exiguobacterium sp. SH5S4]|uniref:hypothetical protein n=1 Tax=Exiguobacterium sp. SH5S4 TaxID=2510961 RepID=UPI001038DFEA|nr:hypothetical protein [Exiguobacterium sp. SH5S4]TCI25262.1 hypothetical protein EVJ32_10700 [Exiguobacterium sp. SH5S4]
MSNRSLVTASLYLELPKTSSKERIESHESIQKWANVQAKVSTSVVTLIELAIMRFGHKDVMNIDVQTEMFKATSPFKSVFQDTFSELMVLDGSDIYLPEKPIKRCSLLNQNLTDLEKVQYYDWIDAQSNLSASVRSLILESIEVSGYSKVTSFPLKQALTVFYALTAMYRDSDVPLEVIMPLATSTLQSTSLKHVPVSQNTLSSFDVRELNRGNKKKMAATQPSEEVEQVTMKPKPERQESKKVEKEKTFVEKTSETKPDLPFDPNTF